MHRTVTLVILAMSFLLIQPAQAQIVNADNIIMRVRPVCNQGQGGALIASVEFKPLSGMWGGVPGRIGGYAITFTYYSNPIKLTFNGVQIRYNDGIWGIFPHPYRSQSFGTTAWFNQHATNGGPGASLPVSNQYFSDASDCAGNPLNDGFFEIMRYHMTVLPTANGTVDLGLYDVLHYQDTPYIDNQQNSGIWSPDLTENLNDSTILSFGLLIPVELAAFNVTALPNGSAMLTWHTESEASNLGFEVQRGDGEHYENIGFVDGHGTSMLPHDYTFVDENPVIPAGQQMVFYRLKQIDTDGTVAYSEAFGIEMMPGIISLEQNYPNPASVGSHTSLPYTLAVPGTVNLAAYNSLGQRVATLINNESRTAGRHEVTWDLQADNGDVLPAGVYFLRFNASIGNNEAVSETRQISLIH